MEEITNKTPKVGDIEWSYKLDGKWTPLSAEDSDQIESEYQDHLQEKRSGQRVYHCFGNGWTALIDFHKMKTYCGSGRCLVGHNVNGLHDTHMTYKIARKIFKQYTVVENGKTKTVVY